MSFGIFDRVSSDILTAEFARLGTAMAVGNYAERADLSLARGQTQSVLGALNAFLDKALYPVVALNDGIGAMAAEHDKGDIDVVLPVERFQGDCAVIAQRVNSLVAAHITVKKKAMACVKEFSEGNFEATLEQFPGKKAFINETIETLRGLID